MIIRLVTAACVLAVATAAGARADVPSIRPGAPQVTTSPALAAGAARLPFAFRCAVMPTGGTGLWGVYMINNLGGVALAPGTAVQWSASDGNAGVTTIGAAGLATEAIMMIGSAQPGSTCTARTAQ